MASASGEFIKGLAAKGRIVITATRNGQETNATRFAGFFIAALNATDADTDQDGHVSVLEAFVYANRLTVDFYKRAGRLATEHALLDDNGDGVGHDKLEAGEGLLARATYLDSLSVDEAAATAAAGRLMKERTRLEGEIEQLIARKANMPEPEYEATLERLFIELAKTQRRKRSRLAIRGASFRLCAFAGAMLLVFASGASAQSVAELRVYIETGRYTEAETAAKRLLQKSPDAGSVRHELAETLAATGPYTEAIAEFERAAADPTIKLESDLRRAELLDLIGQATQATAIYESFLKYYTDNNPRSARELTLVARALVHLERFQDANDMYRSAIEADSDYLDAQLGAAELFTEKYAYSDAALFLNDALKISPNSARAYLDLEGVIEKECGIAV